MFKNVYKGLVRDFPEESNVKAVPSVSSVLN